jgi:hypothetical protein
MDEELTDINLRDENWQLGKEIRMLEFGVVYPDGVIEWKSSHWSSESLEYPENREAIQKEWLEKLERVHLKGIVPPLTFVQRLSTTTFSETTPLA